jgi:hypothetical protein
MLHNLCDAMRLEKILWFDFLNKNEVGDVCHI